MRAAFVDIGLDRAAFIHASEISLREGPAVESISALVHEGQSLVVQVTKDPIGSKGARLTTQLSIPSRYLVYMPRTAHVGISLKIEDEAERERLKKVVSDCVAAEGKCEATSDCPEGQACWQSKTSPQELSPFRQTSRIHAFWRTGIPRVWASSTVGRAKPSWRIST
jgi:predicted RNA-binding protein with RPS1 domain